MIDLSQCVAYLGAELILPGLDDLAARRVTIAACLVSIARPLMEASGLAAGIPEAAYIAEPQQTPLPTATAGRRQCLRLV